MHTALNRFFAILIFSFILITLMTSAVLAAGISQLAADIFSGANSSNPQYLTVYGGKLYFSANGDGGAGQELWVYDGSSAPTLVADIASGANSSNPQFLTVYGGKLYFAASGDGGAGYELWVYDGNSAPTLAADISSGANSSNPRYLAVYGGKLYFSASGDGGAGQELWVYDGSSAPTLAADISSGANSSNPAFLSVYGGKLYFSASGDGGAGQELWVYDGISAPTLAADISSGANSSHPEHLSVYGGKLYFEAYGDGGAGYELWVYDGISAPTLAADISSGANSSMPQFLTVYGGKLYFAASGDGGAGQELWVFTEDNVSPTVNHSLPANGATIQPTNVLYVNFSEEMKHDGSTSAADFTGNYLLVDANGDGFQTVGCLPPGVSGNDINININSAHYLDDSGLGPDLVTLGINGGTSLPFGSYRLFVCGTTSVEDLAGNVINGGLSDTIINFTVLNQTDPQLPKVALPQTGFAPGVVTRLPVQLKKEAYDDFGEIWLEIPSLKIKADILGVNVGEEGWDLTWLGGNVGWLQGTTFPTWAGNSALTAHVYDADGQPGLFANLHQLTWGDRVVVHAWGQDYVYEVRSIKKDVRPNDTSALKHEELPWLTLITCKGYNEKLNSYDRRVIVRAVQVVIE